MSELLTSSRLHISVSDMKSKVNAAPLCVLLQRSAILSCFARVPWCLFFCAYICIEIASYDWNGS